MGTPVVRFEIGCQNRDQASAFYESVFDWSIEAGAISGEIDTGGAETSIAGALTALGHEPHQYVMVYMQVPDIDTTCEAIVARGGEVVIGPRDIPGGKGKFAWFHDPEGNRLGLFEPSK